MFLSYSGLRSHMLACRRCADAGHAITPGAIFAGSVQAEFMVIGQAPGSTEVEAGRPFNAGSGTRLFAWLAQAGFDEATFRSQQYMTSVTKCYPGKASGGSGDRVPSKEEQALCRPYLEAEVGFVDPSVIIPVGRLAINLFFSPKQPLARIIGQEIRADGRWIIPLPHPSGASRWHQIEANQRRIDRALRLLSKRRQEIDRDRT